jgi:uncharacterized protein (TIGR02271 family)
MDFSTMDRTVGGFILRVAEMLRTFGRKFVNLFRRRDYDVRDHHATSRQSVLSSEYVDELELVSDALQIDKETVADGEISIRKERISEIQVLHVPVTREELVIVRRTGNGLLRKDVLRGQREVRIPISSERVTVRKEPVVTDVVKIGRRKLEEVKTVAADLRREELEIGTDGKVKLDDEGSKAA